MERAEGQASRGGDTAWHLIGRRIQTYVVWLSFAGGCLWALRLLLVSTGVITDDAIGHFIVSREAWHRPALLLHHWGRPVDTILYMPAALGGLVLARLTSLMLAALTVLLTLQLGRRLDVEYAFLVPLFLWFQPWFLQLSGQPSLTEVPFSLMLLLSAFLFVSRRFTLASVVIGLFPLIRHEALALTGLWVAVSALRRDWRGAIVTVLPVSVYAVLYLVAFGQWPDHDFPILPHIGAFGSKLTLHPDLLVYPRFLLQGTGLPVAALAVCSLPALVRSVPRLAAFAWFAVYLLLHMALLRFGYAVVQEGGAQRFLLPLAPAVALAAALGLGTLVDGARALGEHALKAPPVARGFGYALAVLCVVVVLAVGARVKPVPLEAEGSAAEAAATWLRQQGLANGEIIATHVYVHYFLPGHLLAFHPGRDPEALWEQPPALSELPPGTIAIWDSHYSDAGYGLSYATLTSPPTQWVRLKIFDADIPGTFSDERARIVIFQKGKPQQ